MADSTKNYPTTMSKADKRKMKQKLKDRKNIEEIQQFVIRKKKFLQKEKKYLNMKKYEKDERHAIQRDTMNYHKHFDSSHWTIFKLRSEYFCVNMKHSVKSLGSSFLSITPWYDRYITKYLEKHSSKSNDFNI